MTNSRMTGERKAFFEGIELALGRAEPNKEVESIFTFKEGDRVTGVVAAGTDDFDLLAFRWDSQGKTIAKIRTCVEATGIKTIYALDNPNAFEAASLGVCQRLDLPVAVALFGGKANKWFKRFTASATTAAN